MAQPPRPFPLLQRFANHQIEFETLRLLSEDDLREMGIPIGPRRRIVESLESLKRNGEHHRSAASSLGAPSEPVERRQLTILFCDIVGSTEYADTLSPEDFRNLTQEYLARCAGIVRSQNGTVVSYVGDAVQAWFGYPNASEDDANARLPRHSTLSLRKFDCCRGTSVAEG